MKKPTYEELELELELEILSRKSMRTFLILTVCVLIAIIIASLTYNNNLLSENEELKEQANQSNDLIWKNFMINGDNVSIYIDGKSQLSFFKGSFSFWRGIDKRINYSIGIWDRGLTKEDVECIMKSNCEVLE